MYPRVRVFLSFVSCGWWSADCDRWGTLADQIHQRLTHSINDNRHAATRHNENGVRAILSVYMRVGVSWCVDLSFDVCLVVVVFLSLLVEFDF